MRKLSKATKREIRRNVIDFWMRKNLPLTLAQLKSKVRMTEMITLGRNLSIFIKG